MLVAFDFDGTLSDSEMIVLLAEQAGVADEVEQETRLAMNDEVDYGPSLRARASLLEGLSVERVESAFARVRLRPGAGDLIGRLNAADIPTAVITGGFEGGVRAALDHAGVSVDRIVANRLPAAEGQLTGAVEGPLIEGTKDDVLTQIIQEFDVAVEDTVAIGDGANDLPMLRVAGTAIGYRPKPAVEAHCDVVVENMDELVAELEARGVL